MSEPFLGEIRMFGFGFPPKGWALCNGQQLAISQNQALFAILGTTYGGNGITTFALPDLRGRMPMHMASGYVLGQSGGAAVHTLTAAEMPGHDHAMLASATVSHAADPTGRVLGAVEQGGINIYHTPDGTATLHPSTVAASGGSQAHNNMQPYATTSFAIALLGIFPSRN